jgi:hypothetical protein
MPALLDTQEVQIAHRPDRLIMLAPGVPAPAARQIANAALRTARRLMPKLSGYAASRMFPIYGAGYFGIGWQDPYVWFQEQGIRAFTMRSLAGKTIPLWIDDPTGDMQLKYPKARTRTTLSGKTQVLIFRKATRPGAPGRIATRQSAVPWTTPGTRGGQIAPGNVGVRWRHPGLAPRLFLNHSLTMACQRAGIIPTRIYAADRNWHGRF